MAITRAGRAVEVKKSSVLQRRVLWLLSFVPLHDVCLLQDHFGRYAYSTLEYMYGFPSLFLWIRTA
jgi:hypothetical protein